MKRSVSEWMWCIAIALIVALAFTPRAGAQAPEGKVRAGQPAPTPSAAAKSSSGPQEGIKVHGHWVIEIRNTDGSLASRHEFANMLTNSEALLRLLSRQAAMGAWMVEIQGPCGPAVTNACALNETGGTPGFGTLQLSRSGTELILKGSVQALQAASITEVRTRLFVCSTPTAPSPNCAADFFDILTAKDVSAMNIGAGAGQTMDVTVRISFS